ncbi:hypothetical protein LQ327_11485 [Actinomycetospora endophytica]|uniref:DUF3558 domain-containing protein n=1 Tax=Actinomycetospora endophytica TaxID=2291215 RepID=A0ABS8P6W8_9PSEU|nr:hypothetical protein [Actinomycetospora endophytica]MCD2193997.1 hypothetical protein [Actinomycetospora endophytica]
MTTTGARRRAVPGGLATAVVGALAAMTLLAGCSSGSDLSTPSIPTFPGPGAAPATSTPAPRSTLVPTDCNQIVSKDQLPNLLGLPIGSVDVRSLRDVPAPSVGRLERVTCTYSSTGGAGAPSQGSQVLKLIASGYNGPQAAQAQVAVNNQVEQRSGVNGVDTPIGAATGTYFTDPDGPILVVAYKQVTVSLTLGRGALSADQSRSVLVDLAQRVLPVLVPPGS